MTWKRALKIINILFPLIGIGVMVFYDVCDTGCSSLRGTFLRLDLKWIGILFMAVLLVLALLPASRWAVPSGYLRTLMLSGALGGEVMLVRFQIVHDTYCPFCLVFGASILVLFASNYGRMNRCLAWGTFLTGIAAFALFFEGSVLPLYR
jgi:uncharacterized membrane protein